MTDIVAVESLFDHRVKEKKAQLEEQREYMRLIEVERDRAWTLALGLRDEVQALQDQLKLEQEQAQERMDSLESQLKDAHLQIEGLEDGIQRHQQQQQATNRETAATQQELIGKWEEWNDLKSGLVKQLKHDQDSVVFLQDQLKARMDTTYSRAEQVEKLTLDLAKMRGME